MNRKRLIAMGIIMTLSMSTVACGKKEEKTEISKVAVEVENPTTGELTNDTTYIGTIEPFLTNNGSFQSGASKPFKVCPPLYCLPVK